MSWQARPQRQGEPKSISLVAAIWVLSLLGCWDTTTQTTCSTDQECPTGYFCDSASRLCQRTIDTPLPDASTDAATQAHETLCSDGVDDDGDELIDCADPDCQGAQCELIGGCQSATCSGGICTANAVVAAPDYTPCADSTTEEGFCSQGGCTQCVAGSESNPAACSDGLDDDCDGHYDCQDPDCDGVACAAGGVCTATLCQPAPCDPFNQNCLPDLSIGCFPSAGAPPTCGPAGFGEPGASCNIDADCQRGSVCLACPALADALACRAICDVTNRSSCNLEAVCVALHGDVGFCCE